MNRKVKRLSAALLCIMLVFTSMTGFTMTELDNEKVFSDEIIQREKISSWAEETVDAAYMAGIVPPMSDNPGYKDNITREQFAELAVAMVTKVCGEVELTGEKTFTDCTNEKVLLAAQLGIVNGVSADKFSPKTTTNREQIATMVNRAIDYINENEGIDLTPNPADISKFTDANKVSNWAKDGVGTLAANGIMNGTSATTLSPKAPCTVEQSIMLLYRVYESAE